MRELRDKVALVTGAAGGIGRETTRALAREGARLVIVDVNEEGLRDMERELGPRCLLARKVDVSKRDAMRALADDVHKEVRAVDVLVNNAGVGLAGGLLETSLEDWDWILSINLYGVIHGCHFFVPKMVERGEGGHVVNVSSALGFFAAADVIGYATAKFGVFGLSEALRAELAPQRIGVSVICPGVIDTGIIATSRFGGADAERVRSNVQKLFARRGYPPARVGDAIVRAVKKDAPVLPVSPEAWALWYMKRFAPWLGSSLGRVIAKQALG